MENNGTHPGGVPVPTGAPTASCTTSGGSNSTAGAAVQTSGGNSTNSTPPQAQSPQTSSSATGESAFKSYVSVYIRAQTTSGLSFYISGCDIVNTAPFSRKDPIIYIFDDEEDLFLFTF